MSNEMPRIIQSESGTQLLSLKPTILIEDIFSWSDCPGVIKAEIDDSFTWQLRSKTTLRESLLLNTINPFWGALLLSVDTIIVWEDGSQTPLAQVIRQLGKGTITQILIPIGITNRKIGKSQVALTPKDKPIVGCYASITFDNKKVIKANLVLTGASKNKLMISESINKIIGSDFTTEMIRSVADKVVETSDPPDDYRGSSDYRLEMARVTTIRALNECLTGDKNL